MDVNMRLILYVIIGVMMLSLKSIDERITELEIQNAEFIYEKDKIK